MIEQNRTFLLKREIDKILEKKGPNTRLQSIKVVDINQLPFKLATVPEGFQYYFTPKEIAYCEKRIVNYAGRLAGKLAVMEVLGEVVPWQDISIEPGISKRPLVKLAGQAKGLAHERGITSMPISISHDEGLVVAFVMAVSDSLPNLHLGTDISSVRRVRRLHVRQGDHFLRGIYTEEEILEAAGDMVILAEKWAIKEAVAKALGIGIWRTGIGILTADDGLPYVNLQGASLIESQKQAITTWEISIIKNQENPIAFVIGY